MVKIRSPKRQIARDCLLDYKVHLTETCVLETQARDLMWRISSSIDKLNLPPALRAKTVFVLLCHLVLLPTVRCWRTETPIALDRGNLLRRVSVSIPALQVKREVPG